ncbi:serine hydrolase domain-containing protein [Salinactinospora qingdaonensis]|uniref:Serine hydrolase domain-containing protein n=1 Tax=Salinactinospora qingdaonensis TaxID=702744 RepID=A0ABP7G8V7_9ACTN
MIMREEISVLLDRLMKKFRVPGAQLSLYHDGELHELALGVEESAAGRPVTPRSRFAFGSVSKIFTAALLMQLVEDGDIDLDAPIAEHLPPHDSSRHSVASATPRQLLSHTAGLRSDHEGGPLRSPSLRRYAASLLSLEHINPPGTAFSYANTGYALAAYLVEAVTAQDWWQTLESYLLLPNELDLAFVYDARDPDARPDLVSGHTVDVRSGAVEPVEFYVEPPLVPAGGLAGSATDLVRFACASMNRADAAAEIDIADIDVLREMGRAVPVADPFGLADGWGAGWALHLAGDRFWYGHDGTLDGGTCNLRIDPEGATALALTTNATTGVQLWEELVAGLRDLEIDVGHYSQPTLRGEVAQPSADITGRYVNGDLSVDITPQDQDSFRFTVANGLSGQMRVTPELSFSVTVGDLGGMSFAGRFLVDPVDNKTVTAMQYNGRALRRTGLAVRSTA